jgi:hypothetical protein
MAQNSTITATQSTPCRDYLQAAKRYILVVIEKLPTYIQEETPLSLIPKVIQKHQGHNCHWFNKQ